MAGTRSDPGAMAMLAVVTPGLVFGQDGQQADANGAEASIQTAADAVVDQDELVVSAGADAANPTAAVNFQDVRYRYVNLPRGADMHSFETEGAYMVHRRLKLTNELRGAHTDRSGSGKPIFRN